MKSPFISDWVLEHARETPDAPAVSTPEHALTYGQLAARMQAFAGALQARGVGQGDRVVIALPNSGASVVAGLAVNALGACAVVVGRDAGREVLAEVLAQTNARYAVIAARDTRVWTELAEDARLSFAWVVDSVPVPQLGHIPAEPLRSDGVLNHVAPEPMLPSLHDPHAPSLVIFTSGSTGKPRGVIQTFANVDANTRSIVEYLGLTANDRVLCILPLSYCYGRSLLQTHLFVGGSVFFDDRFMYPRVVMNALASERCTGFAGVPVTFEVIKRSVDAEALKIPSLRYLTQAGGPMSPDTVDWVRAAFAPAKLFVMYGQTEATARLSYLPPELGPKKRGSIGIPIPGVQFAILDDEGNELPVGESGELCCRGGNISPGYLGQPEESAHLLRGGWMHTGDLAYRDADGFYFIVGRAKELLKVAGHRVSPVEIENVLARHPAVLEAAVVGAPDPLQGEAPVAYAVARSGPEPAASELRQFCSTVLPPYKVPREIHFIASLPRNEAGKLLRSRLAHPGGHP